MSINFDNRFFRSVQNSSTGEVNAETRFHYRQKGQVVWATYEGGGITFGTLIASVLADGSLDMRYSHVNNRGELMTGRCRSIPEAMADGRIRLHEKWQWTSGDLSSGESVVEEFLPGLSADD
jgi:hypothetical protein